MKIHPVHSELKRESVFLKCRLITYGLIEVVMNELDKLVGKVIIMSFESCSWISSVVTSLKID